MAKRKAIVETNNFINANPDIEKILNEIGTELGNFGDYSKIQNTSVNDKRDYLSKRIDNRIDILVRLCDEVKPLIEPLLINGCFKANGCRIRYSNNIGTAIEALPLITAHYKTPITFITDDNAEIKGEEIYYITFPYGKLTQKEILKFYNEIENLQAFLDSIEKQTEQTTETENQVQPGKDQINNLINDLQLSANEFNFIQEIMEKFNIIFKNKFFILPWVNHNSEIVEFIAKIRKEEMLNKFSLYRDYVKFENKLIINYFRYKSQTGNTILKFNTRELNKARKL